MNNQEQKNQILTSVARKMASELLAHGLKEGVDLVELSRMVDALARQLYSDHVKHLQELSQDEADKRSVHEEPMRS